jgi:hypothetical protein
MPSHKSWAPLPALEVAESQLLAMQAAREAPAREAFLAAVSDRLRPVARSWLTNHLTPRLAEDAGEQELREAFHAFLGRMLRHADDDWTRELMREAA